MALSRAPPSGRKIGSDPIFSLFVKIGSDPVGNRSPARRARPSSPPIRVSTWVDRLPRTLGTSMPPADRKIRAGASLTRSKLHDRAGFHFKHRVHFDRSTADGDAKRRPGYRTCGVFLEQDLRTNKGHFKRRLLIAVADESVRQTVGVLIHGAANRHAARLKAPSAQILNRREETRPDD